MSVALAACCLVLLAPRGFVFCPLASGQDSYGECEDRCGVFTGEAKYRCLRTCINTKKRQSPPSASGTNSRFKECEEQCSDSTGLEKIRCIRMCLDRKRDGASIVRDAAVDHATGACESRCAVLSGSLKEKCLARCGKNREPEYRDPLRFKK